MPDIESEIAAYEKLRPELEKNSTGKWVLIHDGQVVAFFDVFESAAQEAVRLFGRGPYLLRQIGAPPMVLPASVMFRPVYA